MKTGKDKISVKQLFFVFTIMVSSPATRLLPKYAAAKAEQAGWVSPIISTVPFILLIMIIDSLLKRYKGQSMSDIINNILGRFLGKLILAVYLLWALWLTVMYTRYYTERLHPHCKDERNTAAFHRCNANNDGTLFASQD